MLRAYIVPHTHWDREWLGTFEEYRVALVQFWEALLSTLEGDPAFKTFLLDGQTAVIADLLEIMPGAADRIRTLAGAGRLEVGPWFTQPDPSLSEAEALIRNLRLGIGQAEGFGQPLDVAYLPDSPGVPAELPTLLAACGLRGVVFGRGMGDEAEQLGSEFWWEGPDGSRVLAVWAMGGHRGVGLGLDRNRSGLPKAQLTAARLRRRPGPASNCSEDTPGPAICCYCTAPSTFSPTRASPAWLNTLRPSLGKSPPRNWPALRTLCGLSPGPPTSASTGASSGRPDSDPSSPGPFRPGCPSNSAAGRS